jgi:hypothetical protein
MGEGAWQGRQFEISSTVLLLPSFFLVSFFPFVKETGRKLITFTER